MKHLSGIGLLLLFPKHLDGNGITCTGMKHIAEGLKVNRKLKSLELDYNSVGDVSILRVTAIFVAEFIIYIVLRHDTGDG